MTTTQMVVGSEAIFPTIVTRGLALNLDGTNPTSYPGTGTTWFDISGNGRNATLFGAPIFQNANTSVGLGSFRFNGISQYASVTTDMSTVLSTGVANTYEIWAKNTNTPGCALGLSMPGASVSVSTVEFGFVGPFYTARYNFRGTPSSFFGALGSQNPPVNGWNQYVITFFSAQTKGYQGPNPPDTLGTPTLGGDTTARNQSYSGTIFPQIAREALTTSGMTNAGAFFNGNVGIVRIYTRALTATEIRQNYNATRAYYGL
jgi:hypothetical protein